MHYALCLLDLGTQRLTPHADLSCLRTQHATFRVQRLSLGLELLKAFEAQGEFVIYHWVRLSTLPYERSLQRTARHSSISELLARRMRNSRGVARSIAQRAPLDGSKSARVRGFAAFTMGAARGAVVAQDVRTGISSAIAE
jgi:hypothetical protein